MDEQHQDNEAGVTIPGYNDWLDAKLREEAPYIDDAGFTARVMGQLPAARRRTRSVRNAILLGATVLASVMAYLLTGGGAFLAHSAAFLVAIPLPTLGLLAAICAILATAIGASAAMSRAREGR